MMSFFVRFKEFSLGLTFKFSVFVWAGSQMLLFNYKHFYAVNNHFKFIFSEKNNLKLIEHIETNYIMRCYNSSFKLEQGKTGPRMERALFSLSLV